MVWVHLLMMLLWLQRDNLLEIIMPRISKVDSQAMSGSSGGKLTNYFLFRSAITILTVFERISARLLAFAHASILSNLTNRLSMLKARSNRQVSSAYLASELPVLTVVWSAALTTKEVGPIAKPWMTLKLIGKNVEVDPLKVGMWHSMSSEVVHRPVVNTIWYVKLGYFTHKGLTANSVKCNDNY